MTYLVVNLASCLLFAQLLGVLLGWFLWGFTSRQRAKEIVVLRKRLADMSQQTFRPADDAILRGGLLAAARDFRKESSLPAAAMEGLPPLPPLPLEEDELLPAASAKPSENAALVSQLQRQVDTLQAQLREFHEQKTAETLISDADPAGSSNDWQQQVEMLKAHLEDANSQLREVQSELEIRSARSSELERVVTSLQLEIGTLVSEKEKVAADLRAARKDFDGRSSWMTKRIHDLERSAEEWERTKQDLTLAARAEAAKPHAESPAANGQTPYVLHAELIDLKERLEKALGERDTLASELAGHKRALSQTPQQLTELQEALRNRDSQLAEQVSSVERLLWRVAELEPFANSVPQLEQALHSREAEIAALQAGNLERDSHIRTLLGRMTELEPINGRMNELQALLAAKDAELAQWADLDQRHAATSSRLLEMEKVLQEKDDDVQAHIAAHSDARRESEILRQQSDSRIAELNNRIAELESIAAKLPETEQKLAAREAEALNLHEQLSELTPLPDKLQFIEEKHQADLTRLKVTSAQRIRKLRQSITGFK